MNLRGGVGEKGSTSHPEHILKLCRQPQACGLKGSPNAHPCFTRHQAPLSQGPLSLPSPRNRQEAAGGTLSLQFSPAPRRGKNKSKSLPSLIYWKSLCPRRLCTFPLGDPESHPSPPFTGWSWVQILSTRGYLGRVSSFPEWSSPRGHGDHSDPVCSWTSPPAPWQEQAHPWARPGAPRGPPQGAPAPELETPPDPGAGAVGSGYGQKAGLRGEAGPGGAGRGRSGLVAFPEAGSRRVVRGRRGSPGWLRGAGMGGIERGRSCVRAPRTRTPALAPGARPPRHPPEEQPAVPAASAPAALPGQQASRGGASSSSPPCLLRRSPGKPPGRPWLETSGGDAISAR